MKNKTGIQLVSWGCLYIFWVMIFQKREIAFSRTATIEFCYIIFIAMNYYWNINIVVPRFLYRKKYNLFILGFITGIIVTALLRVPLAMFLNRAVFLPGRLQPSFENIFTASFLNIFIWSFVIVGGKFMIDRFKLQQHLELINNQKEQAELDFLNAQFNPHFLFNSINSIYGHIDKQNVSARNMLLNFSDMLRYQLYDCNNKNVGIEKELEYIRNYVALQKERKESDLELITNVDPDVRGFSIAPLLFIAFVENAFKYSGINSNNEHRISISFKKEADTLCFTCNNTKGIISPANIEHRGIGIANAKRRLALIYPGKHSLSIDDQTHYYQISLTISIA